MATSSTAARTRNPRGEGGRLRDEIVGAAQQLLDETGDARALSLRSIARRAGISAPSIYAHFTDLPAIMLELVLRAFDDLEETLRAATESTPGGPVPRLNAVCAAYLRFAQDYPERYRTLFGGQWRPTTDGSVTEQDLATLGLASLQILSDALTDCVAADLSDADPETDAWGLWLGLHGVAHQKAVSRVFPAPDDIADRMIPMLARLRPAAAD
jgi:AcrR family transcriptional regulator